MGHYRLGHVLCTLGSVADVLHNLTRLVFLLAHYFIEEKPRIREENFSKVIEIEIWKQNWGVYQQIVVSYCSDPNVSFAPPATSGVNKHDHLETHLHSQRVGKPNSISWVSGDISSMLERWSILVIRSMGPGGHELPVCASLSSSMTQRSEWFLSHRAVERFQLVHPYQHSAIHRAQPKWLLWMLSGPGLLLCQMNSLCGMSVILEYLGPTPIPTPA